MSDDVEVRMELARSAGEGRGVRARRYHVRARDASEERVRRRRCRGSKCGVADDAADLGWGAAQWHMMKGADRQAHSEKHGGDETRLRWLAINLVADQLGEEERALRVPDQHDAAPVIVVLKVRRPGIEH